MVINKKTPLYDMYLNQIQTETTKNQGIFSVRITDSGMKSLKKSTRRNQKAEDEINDMIGQLEVTPEMGRALTSDLYGMRTISSEDNEFRIIYELDELAKQVMIHAVGHRNNVYKNLARFLNRVMPYGKRGEMHDRF